MHSDQQIKHWTPVCELAEIVPNTGVAALIGDQQVAIFHV
ncbi:nitrite reductase (NAD(P)H) small subunit, partial [Escherichia coli]